MTTQTYEPHWEMHEGEQHLVVGLLSGWWSAACGLSGVRGWVEGDYERGVDRCRSCDRSAA